MKALFNLIALVSTAVVMFYVGKGCKDPGYIEVPTFTVDSTGIKERQYVIDSLKEENRELEVLIVRQQDSMTAMHSDMSRIKKQSAQTYALYVRAKATYNIPQQLTECDTIIEQYAEYRAACESFVQESDSIMSHLYVINGNQADIIKDQVLNMNDINAQYMEAILSYERQYGQVASDRKKKRTWQKISAALAALLGITLLAR